MAHPYSKLRCDYVSWRLFRDPDDGSISARRLFPPCDGWVLEAGGIEEMRAELAAAELLIGQGARPWPPPNGHR